MPANIIEAKSEVVENAALIEQMEVLRTRVFPHPELIPGGAHIYVNTVTELDYQKLGSLGWDMKLKVGLYNPSYYWIGRDYDGVPWSGMPNKNVAKMKEQLDQLATQGELLPPGLENEQAANLDNGDLTKVVARQTKRFNKWISGNILNPDFKFRHAEFVLKESCVLEIYEPSVVDPDLKKSLRKFEITFPKGRGNHESWLRFGFYFDDRYGVFVPFEAHFYGWPRIDSPQTGLSAKPYVDSFINRIPQLVKAA
jgi:hypothetical protein